MLKALWFDENPTSAAAPRSYLEDARMPRYRLSLEQIDALTEYLLTLRGDRPIEAPELPESAPVPFWYATCLARSLG